MSDKLSLYCVVCRVQHEALPTLDGSAKNVLAHGVEEAIKKAKASYPYGGAEALTITHLGEVDVP